MMNGSRKGGPRSEEDLLMAVIHDMRGHLRTSVSRAQMIERDASTPLAPHLRKHLNDILTAGRDMDQLLNRLAQYAAAGAGQESQPAGDIGIMFNSALRRLAERNHHAEIDSQAILQCGIEVPYAIEGVLRELLDNALKFRQGPVKITVLLEQSFEKCSFGIRDTGIGFDPEYYERIMRPLERLHPPNVYEGCGMGLAICQRIIQSLGGRLWAESKLNAGSTFWFTVAV